MLNWVLDRYFLSGVYFDEDHLGAAAYDKNTGEVAYAFSERLPGYYHGTGDVFGSSLLAALLGNCSLQQSIQIAVDFTVNSLRRSKEESHDGRFGVNFEYGLADLARLLLPTSSKRKAN